MKFSDSFLDEIRNRLSVSQVVSRRVQLKRAGREWKGLSPFNQEKTASFTVNDQKGFYHCFSSGKHGDIFSFLMDTEGLSFPEAVEKLAGEAGVPLPKVGPAIRARGQGAPRPDGGARRRDAASSKRACGRERDARRLPTPSIAGSCRRPSKAFRIGFAPNAKDALKAALIKKGFSEAQLLDAGLVIKPDDGRAPYDRFRNRLVIPILNPRSRVVGFGARALDPAAEPKYLNSPETRLFDKGAMVFNFARARGPAFDKGELIVVEGYMDVLALHQAGFQNAVATLGTAFTERQMDQLWLLAPEPIICFDGDRAGEAAAARAIDRMLPNLREGHSFRFAFLPQGSDPDDLVRNEGAAAFAHLLAEARPLIDVLWRRECASHSLDTPERRAALEESFERLLGTIVNARVREHYRKEVKSRLWALWRDLGKRATVPAKTQGSAPPQGATRPAAAPSAHGFAITIILALAHHPWLLDRFAEEVAAVDIKQPQLAALLFALTDAVFHHPGISREALAELLRESAEGRLFDTLDRSSAFKRIAFLQPETPPAEVSLAFRRALVPLDHLEEPRQGSSGRGPRPRRPHRRRI